MNQQLEGNQTDLVTEPIAQMLLSDLQVSVLYIDPNLRIVACTPAVSACLPEATGYLGEPLTDLFPEFIGSEEELRAVAHGISTRFDLPMVNRVDPAGVDPRYISLTALPHPSVRDQMVLMVQDVTAEGRLDQLVMQQLNEVRLLRGRLEAANRELVRLNDEKSAFLRMAAHDLRAPLTIIKGYVEMVMERASTASDEEAIHYLGVVLGRAQQMADLIDNLLDVEKIESGAITLGRQPIDLGRLVNEVGRGFEPVARAKGQILHWQVPSDLPRPLGDQARLMQALENLVSNATKFASAGAQIRIDVLERDADIAVEVSDTGPGVSEQDHARLFQRFFRTATVRQQRIPGTGLGLSIVKAIIEQHGGEVYCRSRLGVGSTFGFTLPLRET